jgi:putative glycerol-1-phosphate prenyltransferase
MKKSILNSLSSNRKLIAVLIDPEKCDNGTALTSLLNKAESYGIDFLMIGGSTVTEDAFASTAAHIKSNCKLPLIIFPGASHQLSPYADGILYLSLVSGRNPEYLIGQHVESAEKLYNLNLEILPTAYLLIDGGTHSSVARISQTKPIPQTERTLIRNTAIAAKFQGKKVIYLDAGSGAINPVSKEIISTVSELELPLIVGGGIKTMADIEHAFDAGANLVVIGNKLEENPDFIRQIKEYTRKRSGIEI